MSLCLQVIGEKIPVCYNETIDEVYGSDRAVPPVPGCQGGWIIQSLGLLEPLHSTILLHVTAILFRPASIYMQLSKRF